MDKTLKVLAEGALPSKELDEDDINPTSSHPYFTHKVQVLDTVQRKDRLVFLRLFESILYILL